MFDCFFLVFLPFCNIFIDLQLFVCLYFYFLKGIFLFLFKGLYDLYKAILRSLCSASSLLGYSSVAVVEPLGSGGTIFFLLSKALLHIHLPISFSNQYTQYLCHRETLLVHPTASYIGQAAIRRGFSLKLPAGLSYHHKAPAAIMLWESLHFGHI